jgi:hypothetical protein
MTNHELLQEGCDSGELCLPDVMNKIHTKRLTNPQKITIKDLNRLPQFQHLFTFLIRSFQQNPITIDYRLLFKSPLTFLSTLLTDFYCSRNKTWGSTPRVKKFRKFFRICLLTLI